jgi:hypothetical protein
MEHGRASALKTPAPDSPATFDCPMLVGLAIDVSGSMTNAIQNPDGPSLNRLEAFRESLKNLAVRGRDMSLGSSDRKAGAPVQVFAYGFGFGNPLSILLGRRGPAVRDLLALPGRESSLVSIVDIADNWSLYETHLTDLAVEMLGSTPMREALALVRTRFDTELRRRVYHETSVLFLLSDGMPDRGTAPAVVDLASDLKDRGHVIVSCYVTDADVTEPRRLYTDKDAHWPEGAQVMFDCASQVPENSGFDDYLTDVGWIVDDSARLFAQINRSDVLTEFLNAVISPISAGTRVAGPTPAEVFVSYAHADEEFRIQLEKHLSVLRRDGLIQLWHDRKITPGKEWKGEIDGHINTADFIILLISEDFVASDYCYDVELSRALARHEAHEAVVVPVILKPVDWEGAPFGKLLALPTDARPITNWRSRADAFADVARGIRRALENFSRQG